MTIIENKIKEIIAETLSQTMNIDIDEVVPKALFVTDLGADSLDIVELIMRMEEEFYIEIDDDESYEIVTVGDMIDCVQGLLRE